MLLGAELADGVRDGAKTDDNIDRPGPTLLEVLADVLSSSTPAWKRSLGRESVASPECTGDLIDEVIELDVQLAPNGGRNLTPRTVDRARHDRSVVPLEELEHRDGLHAACTQMQSACPARASSA